MGRLTVGPDDDPVDLLEQLGCFLRAYADRFFLADTALALALLLEATHHGANRCALEPPPWLPPAARALRGWCLQVNPPPMLAGR